MITILVGDVTDYLCQEAVQLDPQAKLITQANCKNLAAGVYCTSLGDFEDLYEFVKTLEQAQHLIYCPPPESWSDEKQSDSRLKHWTEYYLFYFLNNKKISGQDKLPLMLQEKQVILNLSDERKTDKKQLWVVGCSFSHGVGVDTAQRYGQLLAEKLNLPVSFLTQSGTSIQWAADQILRSDIGAGDTVVWGMTAFGRFPYYLDGQVCHILPGYYKRHPEFNELINIEQLYNNNIVYQNLRHIHAVVNFCKKIQAQLFLFGMLIDDDTVKWLSDLPNYKQVYGCFGFDQGLFLDLGSDNEHPGPNMHRWYSEQIYDMIQKNQKKN